MLEMPITVKVVPLLAVGIIYMNSWMPSWVPFVGERSPWQEGNINGYEWSGKIYDTPSKMGINNGRISKLQIWDKKGKITVNYDRGWDIKPKTPEEEQVLNEILNKFPIKKGE